jgi:hypothetical protein
MLLSMILKALVIKAHVIQNFTLSDERPTLAFMRKQERVLNTNALYVPANFTLEFRNF